ncbi:MAG: bifunctional diaminohydroxyphosphoribosylaminopyrimidine deaminase/5-amino-6-(5-phosphoribosylamino)uracil reductase RibD [Planctomycetes bacterium]|nr:bifunctional diaminohydroxyphosphoribosylaminopyrimidine deaminase/5-amino-6-(5-phosphoribosylamino)uracil reductase RibD [Planctomycetota bacterium]
MNSGAETRDIAFLQRAAALAARGRGRVEPNPYVGAVVVRGDRVLGEGAHRDYGGPHAEVHALRRAGEAARGATLYVTLEPCSHTGKTGPCDRRVLAAGVARVVVAALDPSPLAGGGRHRLRAGGVEFVRRSCAAARRLIAPFVAYLEEDRPFVLLKWAMSLDGRIAARGGALRYLTSEAARRAVHRERARADAVLVGSGTVLADDPQLTPWLTGGRPATRVVLDRRLRTPPGAVVVRTAREVATWILTGAKPDPARARRLERAGVRILPLRGRASVGEALRVLRRDGVHRLLVEGGAALAGALHDAGAVDRVQAFVAPHLIGEHDALGAIGGRGAARVTDAQALVGLRARWIGVDLVLEGEPAARSWGQRAGLPAGS